MQDISRRHKELTGDHLNLVERVNVLKVITDFQVIQISIERKITEFLI